MALTKGIVDFVEYGGKRSVGSVTEIDAKRIEAVAEHPRHAEEIDRPAAGFNSRRPKLKIDLITERDVAAVAMIGIIKAQRIKAIMCKQS